MTGLLAGLGARLSGASSSDYFDGGPSRKQVERAARKAARLLDAAQYADRKTTQKGRLFMARQATGIVAGLMAPLRV
jgi:hypothetical protein